MLVPLDGSELAASVLRYVEQTGTACGRGRVMMRVMQGEEAAASDALRAPAGRLRAGGFTVERETGTGSPREATTGRCYGSAIAWGLMASHGRTGLARLFRGSVAHGVVEDAPRPVVV